ncbi:MAG: hypothetical protein QM758_08585 [Armatimonas sp.]
MAAKSARTTKEKVSKYETVSPLLESMYIEFKSLSNKKPDAIINTRKIDITNRLLKDIRIILQDEDSINYLDILDGDDIPQASDVTLMLSQYVAALNQFKAKYYIWDIIDYAWQIE